MVLLILTAIWAVVLIPPWVRSRREDRPAQSIVSFHRRLTTLERTSPYYQAYSDDMYLDASYSDGTGEGVGLGADDDDPAGGAMVAAGWGGEIDELDRASAYAQPQLRPSVAGSSIGARSASYVALRRRRQIFFGLLGGVVLSLAAAAAVGTVTAWAAHGAFSLLFLSYIYLLVRHHHRALEHAAKVRYLSPIRTPRPAVVVLRSSSAR